MLVGGISNVARDLADLPGVCVGAVVDLNTIGVAVAFATVPNRVCPSARLEIHGCHVQIDNRSLWPANANATVSIVFVTILVAVFVERVAAALGAVYVSVDSIIVKDATRSNQDGRFWLADILSISGPGKDIRFVLQN